MQSANPAKQKLKETAKSARVDNGARKWTGATSDECQATKRKMPSFPTCSVAEVATVID
jgi:hypothetical protein